MEYWKKPYNCVATIKNIHDGNFTHNFLRPRVAKDFLRYNLPKEILHSLDIETLKIEPTEFLPSKYRSNRKADILYSVKNKAGKKIYAFLHLEGQSRHDKNMALRILEYHVAIAKAHLRQDNTKVPLILTFVLYHGKEKWSSPKSISELFKDFELYVKVSLQPNFLLNLTEREIEELKKQALHRNFS